MLAIIAPGQGSQTPGMFNSWVTNPVFHELLSRWSMRIDLDLIGLGTKADADEIKTLPMPSRLSWLHHY